MRQLVEGLAWASGWQQAWEVPARGRSFKARRRLGVEPLELLFEAVAWPLASESTRGAFYRGSAADEPGWDVPGCRGHPGERAAFGRPGSSRREGGGAFPQLRLVGAVRDRHARDHARRRWGRTRASEKALADELLGALRPGMLCLADRGFYSFERFQTARQTGAQLALAREGEHAPAARATAPDGSYLSRIYATQTDQRAQRDGVAGSRRRVPASMIPARRRPSSATGCCARSSSPTAPRPRARRALPRALGDSRARLTS